MEHRHETDLCEKKLKCQKKRERKKKGGGAENSINRCEVALRLKREESV